jgi:hypothetical protein
MTSLKSFGCSFVYGSDLSDCTNSTPSQLTWPALIAKQLNIDYECWARPGQGNFKIYCDILAHSEPDSVCLVNWTWIDRVDYVDHHESWQTLRPADENALQKFYYKNMHSQIVDMISNASYIVLAAQHLQEQGIPYIMSCMDHLLFETVDPDWHNPKYMESLQHKLGNILINFDKLNFLDWSRQHNFPVSATWHPLESAHQAAADYWLPQIQSLV